MPRVFVIFRTFDRIWSCKTLTRELAPFEMDMSGGPIKFVFTVDHITPLTSLAAPSYCVFENTSQNDSKAPDSFYCDPHERLAPCVVRQSDTECDFVSPKQQVSTRGLVRRYSMPNTALEVPIHSPEEGHKTLAIGENGLNTMIYFVLPTFRCTLLLDAHVASCVQCEYSRSKTFRRHLMRFLRKGDGFRNCIPDYEKWSEEEKESWENFLLVPYLIDVVVVWPKQKIDYAWSSHILGDLSKHIALEEGFAWLSTLGGAHSSLGETFQHHAKRAGEISGHQLRLAIQLGNESLIARCYVFWSWSLMQRGNLRQCKLCILKTWRFCKTLKCRDRILENMCKAVWSRLRYRRALRSGLATTKQPNGCSRNIFELHDDSSDSETECDRGKQFFSKAPTRAVINSYETKEDRDDLTLAKQPQVRDGNDHRIVAGGNWHEQCRALTKSVPQKFRPLSPSVKVR